MYVHSSSLLVPSFSLPNTNLHLGPKCMKEKCEAIAFPAGLTGPRCPILTKLNSSDLNNDSNAN